MGVLQVLTGAEVAVVAAMIDAEIIGTYSNFYKCKWIWKKNFADQDLVRVIVVDLVQGVAHMDAGLIQDQSLVHVLIVNHREENNRDQEVQHLKYLVAVVQVIVKVAVTAVIKNISISYKYILIFFIILWTITNE